MITYCGSKWDVVGSVVDHMEHLGLNSALTMTIGRGKLGDYFVRSVTDTSSEDTVTQFFSQTQVNT